MRGFYTDEVDDSAVEVWQKWERCKPSGSFEDMMARMALVYPDVTISRDQIDLMTGLAELDSKFMVRRVGGREHLVCAIKSATLQQVNGAIIGPEQFVKVGLIDAATDRYMCECPALKAILFGVAGGPLREANPLTDVLVACQTF